MISFMDIPNRGSYGKYSYQKVKSGNYLIYYRMKPMLCMGKFEFRDKVYKGQFHGIGEFGEQYLWEDFFFNLKKTVFEKQMESIISS